MKFFFLFSPFLCDAMKVCTFEECLDAPSLVAVWGVTVKLQSLVRVRSSAAYEHTI